MRQGDLWYSSESPLEPRSPSSPPSIGRSEPVASYSRGAGLVLLATVLESSDERLRSKKLDLPARACFHLGGLVNLEAPESKTVVLISQFPKYRGGIDMISELLHRLSSREQGNGDRQGLAPALNSHEPCPTESCLYRQRTGGAWACRGSSPALTNSKRSPLHTSQSPRYTWK